MARSDEARLGCGRSEIKRVWMRTVSTAPYCTVSFTAKKVLGSVCVFQVRFNFNSVLISVASVKLGGRKVDLCSSTTSSSSSSGQE